MYIAFSATNESANTAGTADLEETTNLAVPFDVCKLSPIQQIFLCDQATKYKNLWYRLNLTGYTYKKCERLWLHWPNFFWFRCPPIMLSRGYRKSILDDDIEIFLSGSAEPAKALAYSFYPEDHPNPTLLASAWMVTDLEILRKVEEAPGEFGLGDVEALISKSL